MRRLLISTAAPSPSAVLTAEQQKHQPPTSPASPCLRPVHHDVLRVQPFQEDNGTAVAVP